MAISKYLEYIVHLDELSVCPVCHGEIPLEEIQKHEKGGCFASIMMKPSHIIGTGLSALKLCEEKCACQENFFWNCGTIFR